jgi:hypothetical protein
LKAIEVFIQNDGEVTSAYYRDLHACGPLGAVAVALFRAQKRSTAAKRYRRGNWKSAAYDVKDWSMGELCKALSAHGQNHGITWGWKQDPEMVRRGDPHSWVMYVDLPGFGQVSFHTDNRKEGPDYPGEWDRMKLSDQRIIGFCDHVMLAGKNGG